MAAAAPAPDLMGEIIEEILLRLPPSEPESLVRAALACKLWCRLISGARFRRRFREFHRTPPMLGFIRNHIEVGDGFTDFVARFVPTCSFRPPRPHAGHRGWRAVDARHGRVLLRSTSGSGPLGLVVWNPVTDERRQLPSMPYLNGNAAVLCAASGACDHFDCHDGPFLIVVLNNGFDQMTLQVYSSEVGAWNEMTYVTQFPNYYVDGGRSTIARNALYFVIDHGRRLLQYSLTTREISVILHPPVSYFCSTRVMTMEDGRLGVVRMEGHGFSLWSMEESPDGGTGWSQVRVIDLEKLLSVDAQSIFFEHGVGVIFVGTCDGIFCYDLKSGRVRKVCEEAWKYDIVPYMRFYTPAFGAALQVNDQE
ncbi:unnamed protein product [Urochloa decumbens]|uniref:F-box domain-containing protein n=1 Tax=Urochloa decumbens TaxID=240449 RepID=A0ABC9FN77_9POAL